MCDASGHFHTDIRHPMIQCDFMVIWAAYFYSQLKASFVSSSQYQKKHSHTVEASCISVSTAVPMIEQLSTIN